MNKYVSVLVLSVLCIGSVAYAHHEVTGGPATLFVHIDPNDAPVPGQTATLLIDIEHKDKGFNLNNCDCTLTIGQHGTTLLATNLVPSATPAEFDAAPIPFVFPSADEYDIGVSGTARANANFSSFDLDYDVTVAAAGTVPTHDAMDMSHMGHGVVGSLVHVILPSVAIIGSLAGLVYHKRKEKRERELIQQNHTLA